MPLVLRLRGKENRMTVKRPSNNVGMQPGGSGTPAAAPTPLASRSTSHISARARSPCFRSQHTPADAPRVAAPPCWAGSSRRTPPRGAAAAAAAAAEDERRLTDLGSPRPSHVVVAPPAAASPTSPPAAVDRGDARAPTPPPRAAGVV